MRVFVTGGAGYIGSHTVVRLLETGHQVQIFDNLSNATHSVVARLEQISGQAVGFVQGDVRDPTALREAFHAFRPEAVLHFAGRKAVGESAEKPLEYYDENVSGTVQLLQVMAAHGCRNMVFSSSATVYGAAPELPFVETHPTHPANTYGRTKKMAEEIIADWVAAGGGTAVSLRYFNPLGAHPSGRIGEHPQGTPNNLVPYIAQVAVGKRKALRVFGDDYETRDGTGERDYIHVEDLADAHVTALDYVAHTPGYDVFNVGTGVPTSVLEVLRAFEAASGKVVPYEVMPRRAGDIACSYASVEKAARVLGWRAQRDIAEMCRSTWAWQSQNPDGYE